MKKLLTILLGLSLATSTFAYSNLWEYYTDTVGYFPSLAERRTGAESLGLENYTGTADQNSYLLSVLTSGQEEPSETRFGGFRPSGYTGKLLTRLTEGGAEATFNTTPATAPDGTSLTTAKMGDFIVITVNPGAANEEKISASAVSVSGTTATWTIINRGLSFTENVAVTANKKQHAIGETVIISNDDHYLSSQYPAKDENAVITGTWTFNSFPITPNNSTSTETNAGIVEIATQTEIASSTQNSDISRLVIPASAATSTYNSATAALRVVVTQNDGTIDSDFLIEGVPVGSITAYASTTAPTGWLLANGTAVSRTTYSRLFSIIGTSYGVGDGSTTFNLPHLGGRNIVMASSTVASVDTVGETGGEFTHTLTVAEIPAHTHDVTGIAKATGGSNIIDGSGTVEPNATVTSGNGTGGGGAHNVLDPYIVLNYIIKY